jgi:DNA-directed RNA polymerase subunit RPC12/RpoP
MNYENMPCPVCGKHMHEGDDIVVCPDCGTPQHRTCWMENGECANASKHFEGFVWNQSPKAEPEIRIPEVKIVPPEEAIKICPSCGSENPGDFNTCARCGADISGVENQALFNAPPAETENRCPYCGMLTNPGDKLCKHCGAPLLLIPDQNTQYAYSENNRVIGRHTEGELTSYVRKNTKRYVPLFEKFENGKKVSFNAGAFFFGPLWFFFRKLYKAGIAFIIIAACISLFYSSAASKMNDIMKPYTEVLQNQTATQEQLTEITDQLVKETRRPFGIGIGLTLLVNLISAFAADRIYYKKITDDLDFVKSEVPEENMRRILSVRRGGTSILSALCGFFTYRIAATVILYIAEFITNH